MLNAVYCRNCREAIEQSDTFCKRCGADQRQPTQQYAPQPQQVVLPPGYVLQQVPQPAYVLDEMARQYRNLTWLQFVGIFLIGGYLIGLAIIIYAMVQKPAFRRRVAEMGYDPEAWERPLRAHASKVLLTGAAIFALIVVGIMFSVMSMARS